MYCKICGKEIPETRLQQGKTTCCRSCASKASWNNPVIREHRLASYKKFFQQPGIHEKLSARAKLAYQNPVARQNVSNAVKAYYAKEGTREKMSQIVRAAMAKPEVRQKLRDTLNRPEVKQKMKFASKLIANNPDVQQKQYRTKKERGTFNSSKSEKHILQQLEQAFPDIVYQYRSDVYPFNCDFYIPSLDLYIEYHGSWTHGGGPYNENEEWCKSQLEHWQEKAKTSQFYQNAIYTWTDLDVRKKRCAIDDGLNWICFYSFKAFMQWFSSLEVMTGEINKC